MKAETKKYDVRQDPEVKTAEATLNELSLKQQQLDASIAEVEALLRSDRDAEASVASRIPTAIESALKMVPGSSCIDDLAALKERNITLRRQRQIVDRAIKEQHLLLERAHQAGRACLMCGQPDAPASHGQRYKNSAQRRPN